MPRRSTPTRAALLPLLLLSTLLLAPAARAQDVPPASPSPDPSGGGGDSGGDAPTPEPTPEPAPSPAPPPPPPTQTPWPCDRLPRMPGTPRDRCDYFQAHCADVDEGAMFPYAGWYYCGAALLPLPSPLAFLARLLYVSCVLACLPFFFALLGDTAERYFSPIMACVAQSIPKMRPRFAGVTFVALGNGAPDLSSNASAIRSGEYLLAAGAITGGAMFVQCVVGAQVVSIASARQARGGGSGGGVRCAGAMMRDAGVFSVAALSLALALHSGSVGRGYVAWSVALYALYVAWVFAGDEWHAAGRPDTEQVRRSLLSLRERVAVLSSSSGRPSPGRRRRDPSDFAGAAATFDGAGLDEDEPAFLLPASAAAAAPWVAAGGAADEVGAAAAGAALAAPPGLATAGVASPRRGAAHHHHHHHPSSRYVDPLTYRQLVWADLAEEAGAAEAAAIGAEGAQRELRRQERRRQRRAGREEGRRRRAGSEVGGKAGGGGGGGAGRAAAVAPPPSLPPPAPPPSNVSSSSCSSPTIIACCCCS